jgi:peroxiredoxin
MIRWTDTGTSPLVVTSGSEACMSTPDQLPDPTPLTGLLAPADDGAADHLLCRAVPMTPLPSTAGGFIRLDRVPEAFQRLVVYAYPMTGLPGVAAPPGWDAIPGARGCTAEACDFRDHAADLARLGTAAVVGLSTQTTDYQREAVERLRLPFPLASDADLQLARALRLPTFEVEVGDQYDGGGRKTLLRRLTFVVRNGVIEKVFYPVFLPNRHAGQVLAWIRGM